MINRKKLLDDILKRDQLTGASLPIYQNVPELEKEMKAKGITGFRHCEQRFKDCRLDKYNLKGKTVLDFGCDNGMMMYECYKAGAKFTVGIEYPGVGDESKRIAELVGNKRCRFFGIDIKITSAEQMQGILGQKKFDVVLYLSMNSFFGHMPDYLLELTRGLLVYEIREDETPEQEIIDWLKKHFKTVKKVGITDDIPHNRTILWARK